MHVVHARCAGLDVHKRTVVACVLLTQPDGVVVREVRTFGTMTADLLALADWLTALEITQIALESTGVFWRPRPVFNLLEEGRTVVLVNPQQMKAVPGRKTDSKDAEWLADVLRHGLLTASFIPPQPVRDLRELTRYRTTLVRERAQDVLRVHKLLEGANRTLAAVATDVLGTSGRAILAILEALVGGEHDPAALAELARGCLRAKLPELRQALEGRVRPVHLVQLRLLLAHIEFLEQSIAQLHDEIGRLLDPFAEAVALVQTLPGMGETAARALIAELGTEMSRFPSACAAQAPRLLGRSLSGQHTERRPTAQWRYHAGQSVAACGAWGDRLGHLPHRGHLPRCAVPSRGASTRQAESRSSGRS